MSETFHRATEGVGKRVPDLRSDSAQVEGIAFEHLVVASRFGTPEGRRSAGAHDRVDDVIDLGSPLSRDVQEEGIFEGVYVLARVPGWLLARCPLEGTLDQPCELAGARAGSAK